MLIQLGQQPNQSPNTLHLHTARPLPQQPQLLPHIRTNLAILGTLPNTLQYIANNNSLHNINIYLIFLYNRIRTNDIFDILVFVEVDHVLED